MVPALGWSATDIIKLIELSVVIYQAFNDARKNSSRRFQLLSDEFGRFHTCLGLLHALLKEHNKRLYFGHDQFKATLEECQEFLQKYSVLGERRNSFSKFIKTIEWTTEEKSTINRLLAAIHGHAHVIGLYTGYMTLKTSLEDGAINKRLHQETRNEVRLLRRHPSYPSMPFITEEPEGTVANNFNMDYSAEPTAASKLKQVAEELDGFSHVLKRERDSWCSRLGDSHLQNDAGTACSDKMEEHKVESLEMDVTPLLKVLQEVEQKLERARNSLKRECNQHIVRQVSRQESHDSGIADISVGPNSRENSPLSASPTIQSRSRVPVHRPSSGASFNTPSPRLEGRPASFQSQIPTSPTSSPNLGSSPPTSWGGSETNTPATTPMFVGAAHPHTVPRPPSIKLPSATTDWSLFCREVVVTCEGWADPWSCNISQRRRMSNGGLSLRAELADGSCLYHDLPAPGIAVPHTSHTGANPKAKNTVTFKDPHEYQLKKKTRQGQGLEKKPKYIFKNPADHKAFQELIYGFNLEWSWNITTIKSDREKESAAQTLRLWRDAHSHTPVILFYTNTRQRSSKTYIQEPKTSFKEKMTTEKKRPIVRLNFLDQKQDKKVDGVGSIGSGDSSIGSLRSGRASTAKVLQLQWIEIEFADVVDRDKFLSLWQG